LFSASRSRIAQEWRSTVRATGTSLNSIYRILCLSTYSIATGVTAAVSKAVIAEKHSASYPGAHGLTIELGNYRFSPNKEYRDLQFAKDANWDKALDRLGKYWFWPVALTETPVSQETPR